MKGRLGLWFPYIVLLGVVGVVVVANIPRGRARDLEPAETVCPPCGMRVDPSTAISSGHGGRTFYFCNPGCRDTFASRRDAGESPSHTDGGDQRLVDVVCNMEVNPAWRITSAHRGDTYYFCALRCKQKFDADPPRYLAEQCSVCGVVLAGTEELPATYLGKTYRLCSEAHRAEFKRDPAGFFMHSMWGIPTWLYYVSIALVLLVSFGVFEWMGRRRGGPSVVRSESRRAIHGIQSETSRSEGERSTQQAHARPAPSAAMATTVAMAARSSSEAVVPAVSAPAGMGDRFDLFSIGFVKSACTSRVFRFTLQAIVAALFVLIIAAGLFGNQNPALNIAPILTWTVWWGALIILILFAGKAWCYVCPWDAVAGWTESLSLFKKNDDGLSLAWRWPRLIRNILLATIMFVGLTWVELGFGVTMKPRITAYLAIAMLLMAVVSALLFDRRSFCRYGCLVGRVSGLYALFSSVEVRAKSRGKCGDCQTKECVTGSDNAYGCPTFLYPGKLRTNTYCIQCMECVQACPHDNLALNLRPWGSDLVVEGTPRGDEAYLALLMLAITGFHGLTMTPAWANLIDAIRDGTGVGRILGFSLGMTLLMLGPIAIYAALVAISRQLARKTAAPLLTYRDYFIRYAYALLPIALFYHIAHNMEHLLMEGPKVAAMVSDPFGWGWNILGTAHWNVPPLISLQTLWPVQALLVLIGHVYSLWVAQKTSIRLFGDARAALRSQLPMLIGMIAFSVFSLWLLKQPMEMRTSAM